MLSFTQLTLVETVKLCFLVYGVTWSFVWPREDCLVHPLLKNVQPWKALSRNRLQRVDSMLQYVQVQLLLLDHGDCLRGLKYKLATSPLFLLH